MEGLVRVGRFTVAHSGSVVTISASASTAEEFDEMLAEANRLRFNFARSQPGSDWGCDGVGYGVQRRLLRVEVHRSGVGPRKFVQGVRAILGTALSSDPKAA